MRIEAGEEVVNDFLCERFLINGVHVFSLHIAQYFLYFALPDAFGAGGFLLHHKLGHIGLHTHAQEHTGDKHNGKQQREPDTEFIRS